MKQSVITNSACEDIDVQELANIVSNNTINFQDALSKKQKLAEQDPNLNALKTTLKRIKERGYYASNLKSLCIKTIGPADAARSLKDIEDFEKKAAAGGDWFVRASVLNIIMHKKFINIEYPDGGTFIEKLFPDVSLNDDMWLEAIELAVIELMPEKMLDEERVNNFTPYLDVLLPKIYNNLFLIYFMDCITHALTSWTPDAISQHQFTMMEEDNRLLKENIDALKSELRILNAKFTANCRGDRQSADAKKINDLEVELANQRAKNKALRQRLQELEAKSTQLTAQEPFRDLDTDTEEADTEPENNITYPDFSAVDDLEEKLMEIEIPEENVVFLGGHIKLINKMKQLHPKWDYFNDDLNISCNFTIPTSAEWVVVWIKHLSHKQYYKVIQNVPESANAIFATASNITLLDRQIRKGIYEATIKGENAKCQAAQ